MKKNLIFDKDSIAQFSGGYILVDNTALVDFVCTKTYHYNQKRALS